MKRDVDSTVFYYLWDGDHLIAELNSSGEKVAEYSYYPGMDSPHAMIVGTTRYYFHRDPAGNVIALSNESGNLVASYEYDEWGNLLSRCDGASLGDKDRVRYKGALWMGPEVDLYYMRNRWYEPGTGRFLSEDPIGLQGGTNL